MSAVLSVVGAVLIVLLKILFVLFLLLCFLLVCPICYRGTVDYHEDITAEGRLLWLFGLLRVVFSYRDGSFGSRILLFGVDIQKAAAGYARRRERRRERQEARQKKKTLQGHQGDREDISHQEVVREEGPKVTKDSAGADGDASLLVGPHRTHGSDFREKESRFAEGESADDRKPFWDRLSFGGFRKRWSSFFQSVRQFAASLRSICRKIRRKAEWAGEAKIFWYSENTQRIICILKDNVLHLWRKLKPKVLRGNIVFGTGEPCLTGQILGVAAVLYASFGRGIQITPDFEEKRLEGNLLVKGRISLFTIGVILIRIFVRGEWRRFRREAERLKEAL